MLVPMPALGTLDNCDFLTVEWLQELPKNTFYSLWLRWPTFDLPVGYDRYVVSFHLEMVDVEWINRQASKISAPIILLSDLNYYRYPFASTVYPYTYYYWHFQTDKIKQWFPKKVEKNLKFKASAFCNRITQSKMLVFTALAEHLKDQALLKLDDWLEEKNVHFRNKTGLQDLDDLAELFWSKYYGKKYIIDDFVNSADNVQLITADPWSRAYRECLFNFTNESFHYSLMFNGDHEYILPGPFLCEKTFKCLIGYTPFIAVGQFETYTTLTKLGFKFDYGPLDLSWDHDAGNLSRLMSIVKTISNFQNYDLGELESFTRESTKHNTDHIWSNNFSQICQQLNSNVVDTILTKHR